MKAMIAATIAAILAAGCASAQAPAFVTTVQPASVGWVQQKAPKGIHRWVLDKPTERCLFVISAKKFEMTIWPVGSNEPRLQAVVIEGERGPADPNAKRFTKECGLPPLGDI